MKLFGGSSSGKKNRSTPVNTNQSSQPPLSYYQNSPYREDYRNYPPQRGYQNPPQRGYQDIPPQRGYQNYQNPPPQRGGKKKKKGGKAALAVLLVLLILAGGAFAYWKITTKPPDTDVAPPSMGDGDKISDNDNSGETKQYQEERYYTLLVVGDDQEGGNTDTIMVVRFDTVDMKANVISIPRDTIINDSLSNKKINAVFHNLDGIESLKDEIEKISGVRPNNYIMVNTEVFMTVVDAMGGVDFYVPFDMDYDDWGDNDGADYYFGIHVKEGQQLLSGYDALGVFRWRHNTDYGGHQYANPDIDRIGMQHKLLMAIAEKAMSTRNVVTLMNIVSAVLDKCETDLSMGNIQWYIEKFLGMSLDNVEFGTAPTTGAMIQGKGQNPVAYVFLNVDEWMEMVNSSLNPYDTEIRKENCSIVYWTKDPALQGNFYYADPDSLATTDGKIVENNFL